MKSLAACQVHSAGVTPNLAREFFGAVPRYQQQPSSSSVRFGCDDSSRHDWRAVL